MKIFSSFDTKLKQKKMKEYQDLFGLDKVVLLDKSRLFLFVKVFPKIISFIVILIFTIIVSNWIFGETDKEYVTYVFVGVFIILLTFMGPVMKHIMDYYMDFALITPKSLIMFNQTGFFKRDMFSVDMDKVKTILVKKRYFLYSIFDNGDLIFLSEGDSNMYGEVKLYFIAHPEVKKAKITGIIGYEV